MLVCGRRTPARGDAAADPDAAASSLWRRTPFVVGAPGRLDGDGDWRHPRRYRRADSLVGAYVDIEEVDDPTWLRHEVESYARRAVDCTGVLASWCRREVRDLAAGRVIFLTAGVHAELVWVTHDRVAVRLGWQRVVVAPTGSMTIEAPPADFAAAVLGEFPSQLGAFAFDAQREASWAEREAGRLLYYVEEVIAALPAVGTESHRRHALRFVEDNLARIAALRAVDSGDCAAMEEAPADDPDATTETGDALPPSIARRVAALRASRPGAGATPWCAAQLSSSAVVAPAAQ